MPSLPSFPYEDEDVKVNHYEEGTDEDNHGDEEESGKDQDDNEDEEEDGDDPPVDNDQNDKNYVEENERNIAPPANANNPIQQDERSVSSKSDNSDVESEGAPLLFQY